MSYHRLNMFNSFYEMNFNRLPKQWTILQIYHLYKRAEARRAKQLVEFQKIHTEAQKYKSIFYYHIRKEDGEKTLMIISFNENGAFSTNRYEMQSDSSSYQDRDYKLEYLIDFEEKLEIGERFNIAHKNISYAHLRLREILTSLMIDLYLPKRYGGYWGHIVDPVNIKIGTDIFCFKIKDWYYEFVGIIEKEIDLNNETESLVYLQNKNRS